MVKRNLSPETSAEGGGTTEVTESAPNFAALTEEMFNPEYNAEAKKEEIKVEQKVSEVIAEETSGDLSLEKEVAKEGVVEDVKSEVAEAELKLDETELKLDDSNLNGGESEKVWIETARELFGREVETDSYEAFAEAAKVAISEAEERGKSTTLDKELARLAPEAQTDFLLLRAGYTRDEINAPTKEIDSLMELSDLDLIKKDLEMRGFSNELVERELELLTEKELVEHEAGKLKLILQQARESTIAERNQLAQNVATNYQAQLQAERNAEAQTMSNAFNTVKDFMGSPINEEVRNQLAKKYAEGDYDRILNDPAKKAQFILQHHFGEQAMKNIRNKALEEGREKATKGLSNIPPVPQHNNSKSAVKSSAKTTSGFDSLASIFGGE
jgi:hypothetical protein